VITSRVPAVASGPCVGSDDLGDVDGGAVREDLDPAGFFAGVVGVVGADEHAEHVRALDPFPVAPRGVDAVQQGVFRVPGALAAHLGQRPEKALHPLGVVSGFGQSPPRRADHRGVDIHKTKKRKNIETEK